MSPWQAGNRIELRASDGTSTGDWQFEFGEHDDLRLILHQQSPGSTQSGEVIVLGGKLLLSKGLSLSPGTEVDAIDGPAIMLKLVLELLGQTIPAGPAAVVHEMAVDLEGADDLGVATRSASGEWSGPWHVSGSVGPRGSTIRFALAFASGIGSARESRLEFGGQWEQVEPAPQLDESMSLAGWQMHTLGPRQHHSVLDYGTSPLDVEAANLATLRALVGLDRS